MVAKKRLGEMLLEAGVIDETQLLSALGHQRKWGGKLGQALLDLKLATEPQIVSALARKYGYEVVNLAALRPSPLLDAALKLVPRELALRQTLLPIAADSATLTLAMGDPSNISVIDEISFRTGRRVKVVLGGDREIAGAVRRLYYGDADPHRRDPITLDGPLASDAPIETTRDPFAAMPDHVREGYFNRPAHTVDRNPAARPAAAPAQPHAQRPRAVAPPRPQPGPAAAFREEPTFTPPPVLPRAAAPAPATAAPVEATPAEENLPEGEPVLATDLLVDDGPFEAPPAEAQPRPRDPTPREAALMDALARLARGEESALVKPAQLAAALARVLLRRGLVTEAELLEELARRS
jgi:type IV pilus assembly protein PilB